MAPLVTAGVKALAALANWGVQRLIERLNRRPDPVNPLTYRDVAHIQRQIDSSTRRKSRP